MELLNFFLFIKPTSQLHLLIEPKKGYYSVMRKGVLFFCRSLLLFLYSCGATEYMTVSPNMPLFKDKGELQTEISLANIYTGKIAFSPLRHLGILLNGQIYPSKTTDETNRHLQYHSCIEPAIGFYSNFESFFYEGYLGYGFGKTDYLSSLDPNNHSFYNYDKRFAQFNIAYISDNNCQFGACVKYINLQYNYELTIYKRKMFCDLLEATLYISPRLYKNLNFVMYIGRTFFVSKEFYPDMFGLNGSIGLKYYIGR